MTVVVRCMQIARRVFALAWRWCRFAFIVTMLMQCESNDSGHKSQTLFTALDARNTGIDFINDVQFTDDFNIYTYRNFYNGGGVALGDLNNDGLIDVYFTSNQHDNKLYLNKGNFKFEDVTASSGTRGKGAWSTGVSLADVNGDGWLDIYVCNSGDIKGDNKQNELFINNGNMTFTERAEEYGVADRGYTTHAVFFDYDKDGDLDLYILNNSFQAIGSFNLRKNERSKRDPLGGHKLLRNDNGHFSDVSEHAGIFGSVISFGLGVAVGDLDKDGWQDIYVSNDFFERDYLYINNRDGTFRECLTEQMQSVSGASMGADMADIDNDGFPDVFVSEMLPEKNDRIKMLSAFDSWDRYQFNVANGYYHQYSRNTLQKNNGNGTFSEIGRMARVDASDWSWGALIFDMNNDGYKDIFVANGIYHDLTNQDYLQFASSEEVVRAVTSGKKIDYRKLIDAIPSTKVSNYAFVNRGTYPFTNEAKSFGLDAPGFSNGAAYGDLDNDGDLDLITNNVNMPAFVYRNNADTLLKNSAYLKFKLVGEGKNTFALGAQVTLQHKGRRFYIEQMPIRGFESSSDPRPNFGLGNIRQIDSVIIRWPDNRITRLFHVATNQTLTVRQSEAGAENQVPVAKTKMLFGPDVAAAHGILFHHQENNFVDFDHDRLIYHMLSAEGPRVSVGDVNGDGRDDFYIGGAKDQAGALYVQRADGKFYITNEKLFEADKLFEDAGSVFADVDGDGDQDLYVASGGREYPDASPAYTDRLYINNGRGVFVRDNTSLPDANGESHSVVTANDFDSDGDIDLFVGGRMLPGEYGMPASGILLKNNGKGNFSDVTSEVAPSLLRIGMITDAVWADVDGDHSDDLIVVGEYMPVSIFLNKRSRLIELSAESLANSQGWWNRLRAVDIDGDGDVDFVAGNHGMNSRFHATQAMPVTMTVKDFDDNGTVEQIVSTWSDGKQYPMALRHDLIAQIPSLKKRYLKYESYRDQTLSDIFTADQLKDATRLIATTLESSVIVNLGNGRFDIQPLPSEAQLSPVYGILADDVTGDGIKDLVVGGNFYRSKPDVGRYDGSYGTVLKGTGDGKFTQVNLFLSGFKVTGEVRDMTPLVIGGKRFVFIGRNNDSRSYAKSCVESKHKISYIAPSI